jgi:HTH-type transcriptional regulator/antitoxin HigA
MSPNRPAEVFPPGEFIRDELEERGWTHQELANLLNCPLSTINEILNGKIAITSEMATGLATAFGTSAEFWHKLDSTYQMSRAESTDNGSGNLRKIPTPP